LVLFADAADTNLSSVGQREVRAVQSSGVDLDDASLSANPEIISRTIDRT
jgi:hypothetical protein